MLAAALSLLDSGAVHISMRSNSDLAMCPTRKTVLAPPVVQCVWTGMPSVDNSLFDGCTAEGARASDGFGGALVVTTRGVVLLSNGTRFVGNQVIGTLDAASHGDAVLSEGTTVYMLPAPPGHFVFGERCYVQRAACTVSRWEGILRRPGLC